MRRLFTLGAIGLGLLTPPRTHAAPSVEIRGAAARVVVMPEARRDIQVTMVRAVRGLPLRVRRSGERVIISGNVGRRIRGCDKTGGQPIVHVWSRGGIAYANLPQVVIRTPMAVSLSAGDAVFGAVGRTVGLDLTNQGCGDWTVANVAGRMRVDQAGAGVMRTGAAQTADLSVAGSGKVITQPIAGGVTAVSSGSGDITIAAIAGSIDARVAGAGAIHVEAGTATTVNASIAGSGDIRFNGTARGLNAMIAGPGRVSVKRVTGSVSKRVFGSGAVTVGY